MKPNPIKLLKEIQDRYKEYIPSLWIALIITLTVLVVRPTALGNPYLPAVLMPSIMVGTHYLNRLNMLGRVVVNSVTLATVFLFIFRITQTLYFVAVEPPLWDMKAFWLDGSVAARGLNFYMPESYHEVAQSMNLDYGDEFAEEILDNGFRYPPMTMFLFVHLGWFNNKTAAFIWSFSLCITLIADIFLLWKLFLDNRGMVGLAFASLLTLMFPPTINNIWFTQTNFLVLLMTLLFWSDRESARAGVWLALGIVVKPFVTILFFVLLFKRRWRACAYTILTLAAISLLSLVAFGTSTFRSFLLNPVIKVPPSFFFELDKGNLYAVVWRLVVTYLGINSAGLAQLIYVLISVVLVVCALWVAYRLTTPNDGWRIVIVISLGLLIYPNASTNYYSALVPALFLLWINRTVLPGGIWSIAIFVGLEALLFGYNSGWSNVVFIGSVLFLIVFTGIGFWLLLNEQSGQYRTLQAELFKIGER